MGAIQSQKSSSGESFIFPTLLAGIGNGAVNLSGTGIIAEADRWNKMVDWKRMSDDYGLLYGMDEANYTETKAAGNAVMPQVVEWIAKHLIKTF